MHVLEGEFRVKVNDQEQRLVAGDILLTPKGVPHTYRVESVPEGCCQTITVRGDFLNASCVPWAARRNARNCPHWQDRHPAERHSGSKNRRRQTWH